jgi:tetratricopeptide (TPR) repeat protein
MNEFDYLAKAKEKMKDEKYHEVISLCNKALKINENLPQAYSFRGNAKYNLGEYDNAADDFSHAIEKDPNEADHYYDRSWSYCNMDMFEDAIVDINKALILEPRKSLFYYDKGRFEYFAERFKEAVVDLTKGIELKPTERKYIFRGKSYMELQEYDLALADFYKALDFESESYQAYYYIGLVKLLTEQYIDAVENFKKTVESCPDYADAWIKLGMAKVELGQKDALKYFSKAIKLEPDYSNYYKLRIVARKKMLKRQFKLEQLSSGNFIDSNFDEIQILNEKQAKDDIKDISRVIHLEPEDVCSYKMRADRYEYLRDYIDAITDYTSLIELEPDNYINYEQRAFCEQLMGQYENAIKDCDKVLELKKDYREIMCFVTRAMANYKLGNYPEALSDFNRAHSVHETASICYHRGLTNYKLKNYIDSYSDFKKASELNPDVELEYKEKIPKFIKIFLNKKQDNNIPIGLCQIKIKE